MKIPRAEVERTATKPTKEDGEETPLEKSTWIQVAIERKDRQTLLFLGGKLKLARSLALFFFFE